MGIDAISLALSLNDKDYRQGMDENRRSLSSLGNAKFTGTQSGIQKTTRDLQGMDKQAKENNRSLKEMAASAASVIGLGSNISQIVQTVNTVATPGGARGLNRIFGGIGRGIRGVVSAVGRGALRIVAFLGPVGTAVAGVTALLVTFGPKIIPGFSLASNLMGKFKSMLSGIDKMLGGIASGTMKAFGTGLRFLGNTVKTVGKLSVVAAAGIAAIGAAFVASQVKGLQLNASLQEAKAQFEVFTGSALKADAIVSVLQKRADITPFSTSDYIEGGAALMSAAEGSKDKLMELMKTAEMLYVLNPKEGLEGAAIALKNALSGDYTSVQDRFNLDRSVLARLKEAGLEGNALLVAIMKTMNVTEKSIERMGKTSKAQWSTLTSFVDNIRQKLSAGLFGWIETKVAGVSAWVSANQEWILATAEGLGMKTVEVIKTIGGHLTVLWESVKVIGFQAMEFLSGLPSAIKAAFDSGALSGAFVTLISGLTEVLWDALKLIGDLAWNGVKLGATSLINMLGKQLVDTLRGAIGEKASALLGLDNSSKVFEGDGIIARQKFAMESQNKIKNFGSDAGAKLQDLGSGVANFVNNDLGLKKAQMEGRWDAAHINQTGGMRGLFNRHMFAQGGVMQQAYAVGMNVQRAREAREAQINWGTRPQEQSRPQPNDAHLQAMENWNAPVQGRAARSMTKHKKFAKNNNVPLNRRGFVGPQIDPGAQGFSDMVSRSAKDRAIKLDMDLRIQSMNSPISPLSR